MLDSQFGSKHIDPIVQHLENHLQTLKKREIDNSYSIFWIIYFLRAYQLEDKIENNYKFKNPVVKAVYKDEFQPFQNCKDFQIFSSVNQVAKEVKLLEHLDVFKPQQEVVD